MHKTPRQAPSVWRPIDTDRFLFGAAHYPEHVDRSYWEQDAIRMAQAGFNVVRLGEFAWHIFEPSENSFDFELFDTVIALLGAHGISTIMCTPTAAPPRWLTATYPEVLRVDGNGRQASHGSRQQADTASPVYRDHSRRITRVMADHFRTNEYVIGWQTDNEFNTTVSESYSPATLAAFQEWLEKKYGTIEPLNAAWGGNFWASAYDSFDQVVLPLANAPGPAGPGHLLDYHRFLADATASFNADQVEILRAANPDWFVFHNVGFEKNLDLRTRFAADLDFLGFDTYPLLFDESRPTGSSAHIQAMQLDHARAYSGNFLIPEQQSGAGGQPSYLSLLPEPGEMRRMALSSLAHGADGLMFFRWRTAHFGTEIYWMGIIDHDDVPRRRYAELCRFGEDVAKIKSHLLGSTVAMDVGILGADFDAKEAHLAYPMGLPSPEEDGGLLHRWCYRNHFACGYIHPEDDLDRLKLIYVPHWLIWKDEWTEKLAAFAQKGGTVVISARTGSRDAANRVLAEAAPGASLSRLTGIAVREFGRLRPENGGGLFSISEERRSSFWNDEPESARRSLSLTVGDRKIGAAHMYELLDLDGDANAEPVASWSGRFVNGEPAITRRAVGKGQVFYCGTYLTEALIDSFMASELTRAGVAPLVPGLPAGVELTRRDGPHGRLLFVLNTTADEVELSGLPDGKMLVADSPVDHGKCRLPGYGALILVLKS